MKGLTLRQLLLLAAVGAVAEEDTAFALEVGFKVERPATDVVNVQLTASSD